MKIVLEIAPVDVYPVILANLNSKKVASIAI